MWYRIADEYVEYNSLNNEIKKKFEQYKSRDKRCNGDDIYINMEGLSLYKKAHNNLSGSQCELIYSLQQFFIGLLKKRKLLLHASVVIVNNESYVFVGKADTGKSTISQQLAEYNEDSYILSDDRSVIGCVGEILCAWGTPWSKIDSKFKQPIPVKAMIYIEKSDRNSIREISTEAMKAYCIKMYPEMLKYDINKVLNFLISDVKLYLLENDMSGFEKENLYRILN